MNLIILSLALIFNGELMAKTIVDEELPQKAQSFTISEITTDQNKAEQFLQRSFDFKQLQDLQTYLEFGATLPIVGKIFNHFPLFAKGTYFLFKDKHALAGVLTLFGQLDRLKIYLVFFLMTSIAVRYWGFFYGRFSLLWGQVIPQLVLWPIRAGFFVYLFAEHLRPLLVPLALTLRETSISVLF